MNPQEKIKTLKQEIKQAKKLARLQKKSEGKTFPQKLSSYLDSLTLLVCRPFVNRVEDIQQKRKDPDGYQADKLMSEAIHVVNVLEKRKRPLRKKHLDLITGMAAAIMVVKTQHLGSKQEEADELFNRLQSLLDKHQQESICSSQALPSQS